MAEIPAQVKEIIRKYIEALEKNNIHNSNEKGASQIAQILTLRKNQECRIYSAKRENCAK